jgi:prefoldin beta subunit
MALPKNADELERQISEFQNMTRQLQVVSMQKQQMQMQVEEMKMAREELGKKGKGVIYRATGSILIETTREEAGGDIKDKLETFELRVTTLGKQEDKLRAKLIEMRSVLEAATAGTPQS